MAAFNAEATLMEAVASVLASTVPFDLFIVDDGSLRVNLFPEGIKHPPQNFQILRLDCNVGKSGITHSIATAHNSGGYLRRGYTYIARIDVGDTANLRRFERQVEFLEKNPGVGVVGGWIGMVHETSRVPLLHLNPPTADPDIRAALYYNSCVTHSAMMFRSSVFQQFGAYSTDYPICEDYEILRRITTKDIRVLQISLVEYSNGL